MFCWWATDASCGRRSTTPTPENVAIANDRPRGDPPLLHRLFRSRARRCRGRAVATANPAYRARVHSHRLDRHRRLVPERRGASAAATTTSPTKSASPARNRARQVLIYGTAVRENGAHPRPHSRRARRLFRLGAAGRLDRVTRSRWPRPNANARTVMLIDGANRIIASTDPGQSFKAFAIADQRKRGSFIDADGCLVAFARTHGYQEGDGQG